MQQLTHYRQLPYSTTIPLQFRNTNKMCTGTHYLPAKLTILLQMRSGGGSRQQAQERMQLLEEEIRKFEGKKLAEQLLFQDFIRKVKIFHF